MRRDLGEEFRADARECGQSQPDSEIILSSMYHYQLSALREYFALVSVYSLFSWQIGLFPGSLAGLRERL